MAKLDVSDSRMNLKMFINEHFCVKYLTVAVNKTQDDADDDLINNKMLTSNSIYPEVKLCITIPRGIDSE